MSNWEAHTKEQYGAPHFMDDGLPSWCFGFDIAENKAVLLLWKMGGYSPLSYASGTTQEEIAMANESWGSHVSRVSVCSLGLCSVGVFPAHDLVWRGRYDTIQFIGRRS